MYNENFVLRFSTLGTNWNHPLRKEWRKIGYDPAVYAPLQVFSWSSMIVMAIGMFGYILCLSTLSPNGDPAPWISIDVIRVCYWSALVGSIASLVFMIPNFFAFHYTFGKVFGKKLPEWLGVSKEELLASNWTQIQEHARRALVLQARNVLELEAIPMPANPFGEERKEYDKRLDNVRMEFRWKHGNLQSLRLVAKNDPFDKYFEEAKKLIEGTV